MHLTNSSSWLNELLGEHRPPCVSVYMPFGRSRPVSDQNRILYRDLIDRADSAIRSQFGSRVADELAGKLGHLLDDETLREGPHDGLAVFASPELFRVIDLPRAVEPMVEVADSFHIKPLVRMMQQGAHFAVLCLSLNHVRVLEGDQYQLREVQVQNLPRNINETLKGLKGDYPNEPYGQQKMRSHQPPTDKDNMGTEPFFRSVDGAMWHYSREAKLPVAVCADEKHLAAFLEITKNEYVMEEGIPHNPDHLPLERIRDEAWKRIEPRYREELLRLTDQFRVAKAHQKGSDELMQVAEAAANGRVGTLLIDEQAKIPGVLHRDSGMIEAPPRGQDKARTADVLDDLAEMVLQMDGQVYVVPHEQMPTDAGLAAMYRY